MTARGASRQTPALGRVPVSGAPASIRILRSTRIDELYACGANAAPVPRKVTSTGLTVSDRNATSTQVVKAIKERRPVALAAAPGSRQLGGTLVVDDQNRPGRQRSPHILAADRVIA